MCTRLHGHQSTTEGVRGAHWLSLTTLLGARASDPGWHPQAGLAAGFPFTLYQAPVCEGHWAFIKSSL